MLTLGVRCLLVLGVGLWTATASAQTKMTIATGVDPVFSAYYVAQQEGLFKKHGLDVRINTGPSGSAMVAFLVNGQIESAFGSEIAGVANHNLDPNVVVVAQATRLVRWIAVVGRNVETLDQLKGKKVGVARGSGGEVFWLAMIDKLRLNPADYTIVNAPQPVLRDRKSTRLNSSHRCISYAVFCLKKKNYRRVTIPVIIWSAFHVKLQPLRLIAWLDERKT